MSSNGAKNMTFKNCSMSRFDAHRGFWNANLINCEFGQTINVIGGGKLYIENTKRLAGRHFIAMRGDYGATFDGDIILKNCSITGKKTYRGVKNDSSFDDEIYIIYAGFGHTNEKYLAWDFGYTCNMPHHLTIDNFTSGKPEITYVYNSLTDAPFKTEGRYIITEDITYKNMKPFKTCASEDSTYLQAITINEE